MRSRLVDSSWCLVERRAVVNMGKVLLLEEDATYAAEIRRGLIRLGFEVVLIREGNEGLSRAVSERFDLILLSAELPAINGFRICNRVKKDATVGDVPLFLMGTSEADLVTHGRLPTRADDYFTKPLAFEELAARIRLLGLGDGPIETTSIAQARLDLKAVAELQQRLREQEALIAGLNRELAASRAAATRSEAQAIEVSRLRAALEDARRAVSARPPTPPTAERETPSAALDDLRTEHARAIALLEEALDAEKSSASGLRAKLALAESRAHGLEAKVRDEERQTAKLKAQLAAASTEAANAKKRVEELSERAKSARPEIDRLREELAAAKSAATASHAATTRSFDVEREAWEKARAELERSARESSSRAAALDEELTSSRARTATELAEAKARAERMTAELEATRSSLREQAARTKRVERELVDAYEKCVASELKRREATQALSEAKQQAEARIRELEAALGAETTARRDLEVRIAIVEGTTNEAGALRATAEDAARDAAARLADQTRAWEEELATIREEHRAALATLQAERDEDARGTDELRVEFARIAEGRERHITALESELADLQAAASSSRNRLEAALAEARARINELERTCAELGARRAEEARAHEGAVGVLYERAAAPESESEATGAHFDALLKREIAAELEAIWEERLAEAVEEASTSSSSAHIAEMDNLCAQIVQVERERASLQAHFEGALKALEVALTNARRELETERGEHLTERAAASRRMESLEALVASRNDAMAIIEREADEARIEIPQLEAEIVVLRSELLSVRRQLDAQLLSAKVAEAEIERHRALLERAERLVDVDEND